MTDDRIALRELLKKGSDASLLREMIGFAAQRLMELEAEGLLRRRPRRAQPRGPTSATATGSGTGRPGRGLSSCASRSCGRGPTSRPSWSRGGRRRGR